MSVWKKFFAESMVFNIKIIGFSSISRNFVCSQCEENEEDMRIKTNKHVSTKDTCS